MPRSKFDSSKNHEKVSFDEIEVSFKAKRNCDSLSSIEKQLVTVSSPAKFNDEPEDE